MKIKACFFLLFQVLVAGINHIYPQPVINLQGNTELLSIGKTMDIFEDKTTRLGLEDILKPQYQSRFVRCETDIPSLGTRKTVLWCRLALQNKSYQNWYLRIENAYLDTIQIFMQHENGFRKRVTGRNFLFATREIRSANFIIPLDLPRDSLVTVFIRVKHHMLYFPVQIGQLKPILEAESTYNFYFGIFFGIVGIILLANLIMYFSIRDISLIWYLCYTGAFGFYTLVQKGYFIQCLPDSLVWLNTYSPLAIYSAGIFVPLFAISFLQVKKVPLLFYEYNIGLLILGSLSILLFLAKNPALASTIIQIYGVIAALLMIIYGIVFYKNGFKPARFFIIAYSFSLISIGIYALHSQGFIPVSMVSKNALQLGTFWEIIFFTIAIGDKTTIIRKEKVQAQKEALKSSRENEILLQNQNILLEQKVKDRTNELEVEKRKSDDLLLNILPAEIAEEIKREGRSTAKTYSMVTVMFTDFKDFTVVSENISSELLVEEIDYCFSAFDIIVQKYNVEKIKSVGDAYICAGGMPLLTLTHATDIVNAAIEIRDFMSERRKEKEAKGEFSFEIRVGIHTGPVVAGVVGLKKYAYDIWGDTVNIASRMESNCEAGKINISGSTYKLVKDKFTCIHRGKIEAKNKGMIDMYFVESAKYLQKVYR